MSNFRNLAVALLASAPVLACSGPPAPPVPQTAPAPPAAPGTHGASSKGFIGRHVEEAIAEARKELATENIGISDGFNINVNGREIHSKDSNLPKAEITPQGDLLIEGKAVSVTPVQRQQLLAYRGQIVSVAEAGMAIGMQGADIAGEALSGVVGAIFGGKDGEKAFEQRMEAQGKKIEVEALKLCTKLPGLMSSQQVLAASLPAFKPYARMTQADVDECSRDTDPGAVRAAVRDETREGIRRGIRDSIRSAVRPGEPAVDRVEASPANLIEAVETQRIEEIHRQVKAGVDVNARVRGDGTPLIRAAAGSDLATVDALLRLGADVNKSSRGDGNPRSPPPRAVASTSSGVWWQRALKSTPWSRETRPR